MSYAMGNWIEIQCLREYIVHLQERGDTNVLNSTQH